MTISLNEQSFVLESLKARLRTDGRESLNDYRSLKISLDHHTGSAQVQLGKTRVLASVSCDIVRPQPHNPTDGILLINTTFSKMSSEQATKSDATSSSDEEILVSRLLERAFKRSRAIDTEGLCIVASEKVWQIRVDIRVLDHEGNVTDCACIAAMSALLSFKRPDVSVQGYDVVIVSLYFL
jgi:exosome complex component RRP45